MLNGASFSWRRLGRGIIEAPAGVALLITLLVSACVSGSGDDARPDGGSGGSNTGGTGGSGGSGGTEGGIAGSGGAIPDPEPTIPLPEGCAPADMLFECNPITNEGCEPGEACDYGLSDYFTCFPAPNDVAENGACDLEVGPFCEPGLTCDTPTPDDTAGVCHRHCCSSDDCQAPQTCVTFDPEFGTLGVCN